MKECWQFGMELKRSSLFKISLTDLWGMSGRKSEVHVRDEYENGRHLILLCCVHTWMCKQGSLGSANESALQVLHITC